jgi:hypothetical protein
MRTRFAHDARAPAAPISMSAFFDTLKHDLLIRAEEWLLLGHEAVRPKTLLLRIV